MARLPGNMDAAMQGVKRSPQPGAERQTVMVEETASASPDHGHPAHDALTGSGSSTPQPAELSAADIMTTPVICARADMTVRALTEMLRKQQISGVPVVDAEKRLVGVISITDLIGAETGVSPEGPLAESDFHSSPAMDNLAAAGGLLEPDESLWDSPVAQFMSPHVITVTESTGLGRLAKQLLSHRIHRLIVVAGDRIAGIVTVRDILRSLQQQYTQGQ
jgi:CBS domain-containing protein